MSLTDESSRIEEEILGMERAALDRWGKGEPDGYLEIDDEDVTYFDPFTEQRVDGLAAMRAWLEPVRGKIRIDRDEMIGPRVQVAGDVAVLTMRYNSSGSEGGVRWNCTEVYRRRGSEWKIIHSHWSFTGAGKAQAV